MATTLTVLFYANDTLLISKRLNASEPDDIADKRKILRQDLIELEKTVKGFSLVFEKVAELVGPSVVRIKSEKEVETKVFENGRFFSPMPKGEFRPFPGGPPENNKHKEEDIGSGVIVDERGFIVTNNHVVAGFDKGRIEVTLQKGETYEAKIVGSDPKTDLAIIKIEGGPFQTSEFGDASKMHVGDWALAIGSPFDYQQTVSAGIIGAIGRKHVNPFLESQFSQEDFIQTDVAINPGSSGGPLVNLRGEIIGINSAIITKSGGFQGIGFAISSSIAKKVAKDIIEKGHVMRGYIGVAMLDINEPLAISLGLESSDEVLSYYGLNTKNGSFVARVWTNTPAENGGMIPGDVIITMDNKEVKNSDDLQQIIRGLNVDSSVETIVMRNGIEKSLNIKIGEQPDNLNGLEYTSVRIGIVNLGYGLIIRQLTVEMAKSLGYGDEQGIIVVEADKGGAAKNAGIAAGDIISGIGFVDVNSIVKFCDIFYKFKKGGKHITIKIKSKGFVTLF